MHAAPILLPPPRRLEQRAGLCRLATPGAPGVPLDVAPDPALPPEGYTLDLTPDRARLAFADAAGRRWGEATLRQLQRQYGPALPACRIEDAPAFASRGLMLDISRDKVPTMASLLHLVEDLAALKFNRLELYTEHTFAYRNHPEVWAEASPLTGDEVRTLDAHARARGVELVPNQNSFGHLHRWLKHARYRDLAEAPDGFTTPWGERRSGAFSLNPRDPRSLALLEELYAELLPHFTSRQVNVGCDETFDLGQGRSRTDCERLGKGRVYLDFLLGIHRLVQRHGRMMNFWGDIILHHPELIPELPRNAVALVWGYEADHPFDEECAKFAAAGLPFLVCPGTSAWNSLLGRTDNARANLAAAAAAGLRHGTGGYLVTDWGDNGHWQPAAASLLPYADAACCAWSGAPLAEDALLNGASLHVFEDPTGRLARGLHDLGLAYRALEHPIGNQSALFALLQRNDLTPLRAAIPAERMHTARARLDEAAAHCAAARPACRDAALLAPEIEVATGLARAGLARGLNEPFPEGPALLDAYRAQWLARNRPGGLADSTRQLTQRLV